MHPFLKTIRAVAASGATISFGAISISAMSPVAIASDFGPGHASGLHAADHRCAEYGPDFAPVEGSNTCVRIGGRVRVDVGRSGASRVNSGWATGSAAPAAMRSGENDYEPPAERRRLHLGTLDDPFGN